MYIIIQQFPKAPCFVYALQTSAFKQHALWTVMYGFLASLQDLWEKLGFNVNEVVSTCMFQELI